MTCKLMAGNDVLLEQEYYSVGGGFIEWKGYTPPKKNPPKYPFSTMKELREHADKNKLTIAQVILANEMAIPGRSEAEVWAFVDKIINAMNATVKSGLAVSEDDVLPGPIKLHSKAATVYKRAMTQEFQSDRGIARHFGIRAGGLRRERAGPPGHHRADRRVRRRHAGTRLRAWAKAVASCPLDKIRDGMLAAAAIGYLCKHNATLSAAEGGCQAEIGVASAMAAAMIVTAYGGDSKVVENAAESALGTSPGHDLRSGGRVRPDSVYRAMRLRRGQGMDGVSDRHQ